MIHLRVESTLSARTRSDDMETVSVEDPLFKSYCTRYGKNRTTMIASFIKRNIPKLLLVTLLIIPRILFSQQTGSEGGIAGDTSSVNEYNRKIHLDISSHSGTPPVLEFELKDPDSIVSRIDFDFDDDGAYDISIIPNNAVVFRGVVYRRPGRYRMRATLQTDYGGFDRLFTVSYTPFVWGRNNFNFANDGIFENKIDFVSDTILEWARERFGELEEEQQVTLLAVMYRMYKGSIGRCYGFTGGEIFYRNHPDALTEPYMCAYDLREDDMNIIRQMDFIQNDIVFANYLSGHIDIEKPQDMGALKRELAVITQSIRNNRPIIIGYISSRMHHSMVVYGYFENLYRGSVTLLTANNWEREQNNNIYSEDAENIVCLFPDSGPKLSWYDVTKNRYRYPRKIFAIEPRDHYVFSRSDLLTLLETTKRSIQEDGRAVVIVEKTGTAVVTDSSGKKRGYSRPRIFNEINTVGFKKIDYNYIFEVPTDAGYTLHLKNRRYNGEKKTYKKVNIFTIFPGIEDIHTSVLYDVPVDDSQETVFAIGKNGIELVHD